MHYCVFSALQLTVTEVVKAIFRASHLPLPTSCLDASEAVKALLSHPQKMLPAKSVAISRVFRAFLLTFRFYFVTSTRVKIRGWKA